MWVSNCQFIIRQIIKSLFKEAENITNKSEPCSELISKSLLAVFFTDSKLLYYGQSLSRFHFQPRFWPVLFKNTRREVLVFSTLFTGWVRLNNLYCFLCFIAQRASILFNKRVGPSILIIYRPWIKVNRITPLLKLIENTKIAAKENRNNKKNEFHLFAVFSRFTRPWGKRRQQ